MSVVFNEPPGWPPPPAGWAPTQGWLPDPSWPPAPPDWQFWTDAVDMPGSLPASAWAPPVTPSAEPPGTYGSMGPRRPPSLDTSPAAGAAPSSMAPALVQAEPQTPAAPAPLPDRSRLLAGVGWGSLAMTALVGLTSGIGGVLLFAGLFAFVVAIVAVIRGRVTWAHLPTRGAGAVALAGSVVAVVIGTTVLPTTSGTSSPPSAGRVVAPPVSSSAASPTATSTTTTATQATPETDLAASAISEAQPGTALALVGTLKVQGRGAMTGYTRALFGPAWTDTDRNGCDQRNDTLRRDLQTVSLKAGTNGCTVMTGTLTDPYTATTAPFTRTTSTVSPVQIDHVVALADAWVKGAAGWPQAERTSFANDTLNLVAVSASVNAAKGAGDAATWLPPAKAYRCSYVARQVAVKAKYQLAVTGAERAAVVAVLTTCVTTRVPTVAVPALGGFPLYAAPTPAPAPTPSTKPTPRPAPRPTRTSTPQAPAPIRVVSPGAFCSPEGDLGHTKKGTLMRCSMKAGDNRARWRAA